MTWLWPRPLTSPSITTIAPMGTSPASLAAAASTNASRMNSSSADPMLRIRFKRQRRMLAATRLACQEDDSCWLQSRRRHCTIDQRAARRRQGCSTDAAEYTRWAVIFRDSWQRAAAGLSERLGDDGAMLAACGDVVEPTLSLLALRRARHRTFAAGGARRAL